jgi:hypothetical protein
MFSGDGAPTWRAPIEAEDFSRADAGTKTTPVGV